MARTLVQFDFPYPGPWGAEMAQAMDGLARDIAGEEGLLWKIWTESQADGLAGGIYVFETRAAAEAYRDRHAARLAEFGISDIRARLFDMNDTLSDITRAPL